MGWKRSLYIRYKIYIYINMYVRIQKNIFNFLKYMNEYQ